MSQTHDIGCVHNSTNKRLTIVHHVDAGTLPPVTLCSVCISFYKKSTTFKIIDKSALKNLETFQ